MTDTGLPVPQGTALSTALTDYNAHVHPESGLGIYVPRNCQVKDFSEADFLKDGLLHENWLPLAGIVPAGAKAVSWTVLITSLGGEPIFHLYPNVTTKLYNSLLSRALSSGVVTYSDWITGIDPDLLMDALCDAGIGFISLFVTGWWL